MEDLLKIHREYNRSRATYMVALLIKGNQFLHSHPDIHYVEMSSVIPVTLLHPPTPHFNRDFNTQKNQNFNVFYTLTQTIHNFMLEQIYNFNLQIIENLFERTFR